MLSADNEVDEEGVGDNNGYDRASPSDVTSHLKLSNGGEIITMAGLKPTCTSSFWPGVRRSPECFPARSTISAKTPPC